MKERKKERKKEREEERKKEQGMFYQSTYAVLVSPILKGIAINYGYIKLKSKILKKKHEYEQCTSSHYSFIHHETLCYI